MNFKVTLVVMLITVSLPVYSGNYVLTIDGKKHELELGEQSELKVGGETVSMVLDQKPILTYQSDMFSFDHPKQFIPAKTDLGSGIYQTLTVTPLGSLVLLQEYNNFSPVDTVDLIIDEVTKEEREYGYKMNEEAAEIKLKDGKSLIGKRIFSKHKEVDMERFVGAYGEKDSGVLVMTQIDHDIDKDSSAFIQGILDSLIVDL